jgi:hypothetical protein
MTIEHVSTMQVLLLTQGGGLQARAVIFRDGNGVPINVHYYPNALAPLGDERFYTAIKPEELSNWAESLVSLVRYLAGFERVAHERGAGYLEGAVTPQPAVPHRPAQRGTIQDLPLDDEGTLPGDAEHDARTDLYTGGDPFQL